MTLTTLSKHLSLSTICLAFACPAAYVDSTKTYATSLIGSQFLPTPASFTGGRASEIDGDRTTAWVQIATINSYAGLTGVSMSSVRAGVSRRNCSVVLGPDNPATFDELRRITALMPVNVAYRVSSIQPYTNNRLLAPDGPHKWVDLPSTSAPHGPDSVDIWTIFGLQDLENPNSIQTSLPAGTFEFTCDYYLEAQFTIGWQPTGIGYARNYRVNMSHTARTLIKVKRSSSLQVSSPVVECGTVFSGSRGYTKCPVVFVTEGGKPPDPASYTLTLSLTPGPYNLYADAGNGKIVKIVNGGEYVRGNGSLHLYVSGEGAPVGKMNQTLTITARAK